MNGIYGNRICKVIMITFMIQAVFVYSNRIRRQLA